MTDDLNNIEDSVAKVAFRDALEILHSLEIKEPKTAPPFGFERLSSRAQATQPHMVSLKSPSKTGVAKENSVKYRHPLLTNSPTLREAATALRKGEVTSRELVENSIEAWHETQDLGAVVELDENLARKLADAFDADMNLGVDRGPLHGIPVTVKDVIDVASMSTCAGSLAYNDQPIRDATSVARLRDAGALMLAKVATHEFALGVTTPQCKNPFDPKRISGGSSGGSAIAVSCGIGLASLGTDTRASLRVPSALCGVVGFKPTFGFVPTDGIVPLSWTVDHIGPITRTVSDASMMLSVLGGKPFIDIDAQSDLLGDVSVGVISCAMDDADSDVADVIESVFPIFSRLGYKIYDVDAMSSVDFDEANALGLIISRSEASTFHRSNRTDLALCIPEVRDQLTAALDIRATDYLDAQRNRKFFAERILSLFDTYDVLVLPTVPMVAPPRDDYERYLLRLSKNAIPWSLIGNPAVSVPCGLTNQSLPVGLQFVVAPGNEELLVRVGVAFEEQLRSLGGNGS